MANITDERGFNQIFRPSEATSLRLRRRVEAMVREMKLPDSAEARAQIQILEIGCGMGEQAHDLAELTGATITGIDLSSRFIEHARATYPHPRIKFILGDLNTGDPTGGVAFDYVVGNGILHHLYHTLDTFLPVMARALKPGGRMIFWEPNLLNPYAWAIFTLPPLRRAAKLEPDEMAFTPAFIRRKLAAAGFQRIRTDTRDFLVPITPEFLLRPVVALSNVLDRVPVVNRVAQSIFLVAER